LEGELTKPELGLSPEDQKWIALNCEAVVHCAAAMVFQPDAQGEPHRTNVGGMRNLLDCCRRLGIRRIHHVSTAYVCGLRTGRVLEDELDVGQTWGNVYEESKIEAEKLLLAADWLEKITVFRPASIIGDSQTGYTSNYHGFYLPLLLAYSFAATVPPEEMNERFIKRLGLSGTERKNFVPVDWVASAITYVVTHPEHHGRTYHLAAPEGVNVQLYQSVVQEAIRRYCRHPNPVKISPQELDVYEKLFHDQLLIYRSHWRDDPFFDLSNAREVLGHMPCPKMDFDLLLRVARWPIENKFVDRRHEPISRPVDARRLLNGWLQTTDGQSDRDSLDSIDFQVTGSGGGQWRLLVRGDDLVGAEWGISRNGIPGCHLNSDTLAALTGRRLTVEESIRTGRLVIEGPRDVQPRLVGILKKMVEALPSP
jgi:nucleoside-diphosphate-sugar epimerase